MTKQVSAPIRIHQRYTSVLLASHGLSRRQIAEEAAVSRVVVTKTLRNYRGVRPEKRMAVLSAIARLCRCEVEELVMGRLAA